MDDIQAEEQFVAADSQLLFALGVGTRQDLLNSSSRSAVFGPRFPGCRRSDFSGPPRPARNAYTLDRTTR